MSKKTKTQESLFYVQNSPLPRKFPPTGNKLLDAIFLAVHARGMLIEDKIELLKALLDLAPDYSE